MNAEAKTVVPSRAEMYKKLDELIIDAVRKSQSSPTSNHDVLEEARRIAWAATPERYIGRVIDGRVQALRRAGLITYHAAPGGKSGWYIYNDGRKE